MSLNRKSRPKTSRMARELKSGVTEATTTETSRTAWRKVTAFTSGQTDPSIQECGQMMKWAATAAFSGLMVVISKAPSKTESCMDTATMCGKTAVCMQATTDLTRSMARALTPTLMVVSTVVSGSTECNMASGASSMLSPLMKGKASGPLVSLSNGLRPKVNDLSALFQENYFVHKPYRF